jgi:radical SAM family uncharacterized protein
MIHSIEEFLPLVAKPGRYVGGEINKADKNWDETSVRVALAFPETYEIGMSHIGLKILYHIINSEPSFLAERVFAPWRDMEQQMRERKIPLYSLESYRPLSEFHIIGFSLQYEMTYTNVLNMLDLAGMPVLARERADADPIIIAGGPCVLNPEPMADFIDAFIIGEAEEAIVAILQSFDEATNGGGGKGDILREWSRLQGVYVPSLYEPEYDGDKFVSLVPSGGAPETVSRLWVKDLESSPFPTAPPVPLIEAVHDRFAVEIMRGCTRGYRFCHAGMAYRPVRERSVKKICDLVDEGLANTGCDGITLASLSSTDYSDIETLVGTLNRRLAENRVSISLPSLRLDSFSIGIAEQIQEVRKSGFTFAPEAATDRLRRVINKDYAEESMFASLEGALRAGWDVFKLYFMLGLPTETEEDVAAIGDLIIRIRKMGRKSRGKRFRANVSLSAFVPKPHTPFQWENMVDVETLKTKYRIVTGIVRHRDVKISWREPELCMLEAMLARGDRRMSAAVCAAWKGGARFDGWSSELKADVWESALRECGMGLGRATDFPYGADDPLPWDHIQTGVKKKYLVKEKDRSRTAEFTADCREKCLGCGICGHVELSH